MIKFDRGVYSHWGIYIGQREIVHVSFSGTDGVPCCKTFCKTGEKAVILRANIDSCAMGDKFRPDNYLDEKHKPRSAEEIVSFALQRAKFQKWDYDVVRSNCEHFAILCRYGIKDIGEQAKKGIGIGTAVIGVMASFGGLLAARKYFLGSGSTSTSRRELEDENCEDEEDEVDV